MVKLNNRMVILQISVRFKKKVDYNFIVYRKISSTLAHKGPSGTGENLIIILN